jgi:hypothetical protein
MHKGTLTLVVLAGVAAVLGGTALADPAPSSATTPLATSPHPDPKMPPMPSMEGPEPTGDMAKPPLSKPASTKPTASVKAVLHHEKLAKHAEPAKAKSGHGRTAKSPVVSKAARKTGHGRVAAPTRGKKAAVRPKTKGRKER